MLQSLVSRLKSEARINGWWLGPQAVVVVVLSVMVGLWGLWLVYASFNSLLVWQYAGPTSLRSRRRRHFVLKLLAIPLLPVGILSALSGGGMTPRDHAVTTPDGVVPLSGGMSDLV